MTDLWIRHENDQWRNRSRWIDQTPASVTTYSRPSGDPTPTAQWSVVVNGQSTWTHHTDRGATATWSTDAVGVTHVEATASSARWGVTVRAQQPGMWPPEDVEVTVVGSTVSFTLPTGFTGHCYIVSNGRSTWDDVAHLSAMPLEVDPPTPAEVTHYFGPGLHTGAAIQLASDQSVYIAGGALVKRRIYAGDLNTSLRSNISVTGRGILDLCSGWGLTDRTAGAFLFGNVDGLTLSGFTLISRWYWAVQLYNVANVGIDWMRVFSSHVPGGTTQEEIGYPDGIDFLTAQDCTIQNSYITAADDSSALKTTKYGSPAGDTDNILYTDCMIVQGEGGNGLEIGYELGTRSITNIVYRRIYIALSESDPAVNYRMAPMGIHNPMTAIVDGVLYEDILVEAAETKDYDLYVGNFYISSYGASGDSNRGQVKNITYRRVQFSNDQTVRLEAVLSDPTTYAAKKITNVTFDSCMRGGVALTEPQGDWTLTNTTGVVFT